MNIRDGEIREDRDGAVTEQAHAKINLSLDILGKRDDGYHILRMVMQTLELCDVLTISSMPEGYGIKTATALEGQGNGSAVVPDDKDNLAYRAAALMKERCGIKKGLDIRIEKRIPVAAGLAGGSSDAAATIRGLDRLFRLGMSLEEMAALGAEIGSDVPYCVYGGTKLVEGAGEIVKRVSPELEGCGILLIKPDQGVSTKEAYEAFDRIQSPGHPDTDAVLSDIARGDIAGLGKHLGNVLEAPAFGMVPVIKDIRDFLRDSGAKGALMSGSGSTVFALDDDFGLLDRVRDEAEKEFKGCRIILTKTTPSF